MFNALSLLFCVLLAANNLGKTGGAGTADEKNQVSEYAALMSGKGAKQSTGNPMEDMLFNDAGAAKKGSGCVIC